MDKTIKDRSQKHNSLRVDSYKFVFLFRDQRQNKVGKVNMELQLDATVTVLLISKIS
jgi:hypothetical protein